VSPASSRQPSRGGLDELVAQAALPTAQQRSHTSAAAAARSAAQQRDPAAQVSVFVLRYFKASNSKACNLSTSKQQVN
jgi:hypothetical protein